MFGDIQTADNLSSDIMGRAKSLVQALVQTQKQQRSEPYANTLKQIGEKFATSEAKMRPMLNQQANKTRADYIASGGSPIDLDQGLWGSDPSQGFQTGEGQFTPGYAGDNMSMGQKLRLAPTTGKFEGNPTFDALMSTLQNKLQNRQLDMSEANSQRDYSASMGNLAETQRYHDANLGQQNLDNLYRIWQSTGKAPEGIPGVTAGTEIYDKVGERDNAIEKAIGLAQKDDRFMYAETSEEKQAIIKEYYDMLSQQSENTPSPQQPSAPVPGNTYGSPLLPPWANMPKPGAGPVKQKYTQDDVDKILGLK
jgi:hypothetical protein